MSRQVTHDGAGAFEIRFPFDRTLVDLIKTLPHRRWNAADRHWWVPDTDVVQLVDLLRDKSFRFDEATRGLYERMGGSADLERQPPKPRGRLPLFDDPSSDGEPGEAPADQYTISQLNERVREAIESAFPSAVWVVGEISGFNKNSHRRHVGFHIVERDESGASVSEVSATLFEGTRKTIERALAAAGNPFRLEDEVEIRLRARVELYVPWGSYRIVVEELDLNYTLGEAARRREEILRRLADAGLLGRNAALPLSELPLRVGLITSLGSDAFNDVRRSLEESGFAFRLTAHGARVQGRSTEPSVLNALDWFRERADAFDVVLICRGGGSRIDLAWFDSEPLGRAVALFPLPVIVGIGHEQDQSVLDGVGRRAKTPTAAAALLVETVQAALDRVHGLGLSIVTAADRRVREEARLGLERIRRLGRASGNLLARESAELLHRQKRTVVGARGLLAGARQSLGFWSVGIPRAAALLLDRHGQALRGTLRSIIQAARRDLQNGAQAIRRMAADVGPRARRMLQAAAERTETRRLRLRSVDPRTVVDRGYAILRAETGEVLTDAKAAPPGAAVRAELRRGSLKLRSEGSD